MESVRKIAVAGATGRLGRHVVEVLEAQGDDVVPIARSAGVDVVTGEGLEQALTGVDWVIDTATPPSPDEEVATAFFTSSARNLHSLGEKTGVRGIVLVSIVGVDHSTGGYYTAKLKQEQAMMGGPLPVRILRATQFHEYLGEIVEWGRRDGIVQVPKMRTQPIAARNVADFLADLVDGTWATSEREGLPIPEVGGPREEKLSEVERLLLARRGDTSTIEEVSNPDDPLTEMFESGDLLPGPSATLAGPSFEEWLEQAA